MAIKNYFKKKKPAVDEKKPETLEMAMTPPSLRMPFDNLSLPGTPSGAASHRGSTFADGMKYELMVNHIYQQQCQRMWLGDDSGVSEGILLRKSMGNYLACPPNLASSYLADACTSLNVQVGFEMT